MNKRLLIDIIIMLLIILLIVIAAKHDIKDCEGTLSECNQYIKENCTTIITNSEIISIEDTNYSKIIIP